MKYCKDCGEAKSKKGNYCKKCGYNHRVMPKGIKRNSPNGNKSWFKKGHTPWTKTQKGIHLSPKTEFKKGVHTSLLTEFKKGQNVDEKNLLWKGDKVGYHALHAWVQRKKGKARICSLCSSIKNVQWANKSHEYKRDLDDWIELCSICHRKYDGITKFSKEVANLMRNRLQLGEKQEKLAREFGVNQATISNIFRNKIKYYG